VYGSETIHNGRLLTDYGFIWDNHPKDFVVINVPEISEDDPLYFQKLDMLDALKLSSEVKVPKDKVPFDLLNAGRIQQLIEEELESYRSSKKK